MKSDIEVESIVDHVQGQDITAPDLVQTTGNQTPKTKVSSILHILDLFNKSSEERRQIVAQWEREMEKKNEKLRAKEFRPN